MTCKPPRFDRGTLVLRDDDRDKLKLSFMHSDLDRPTFLEALDRSRHHGNGQVVEEERTVAGDAFRQSFAATLVEEPPTPRALQAIEEGFPEKHVQKVEPILTHLDEAVAAALRGDV